MIEDKHYTVNEATGIITFIHDEPIYKIEKIVFAEKGIEINNLNTLEEYNNIRFRYIDDIMSVINEKALKKLTDNTLEHKAKRYLYQNNYFSLHKLNQIISRKRALKLIVIK